MTTDKQPPQRLAYNQKDAAAQLGMGVDHFKVHVRPHLARVYVGDKILYPATELQKYLDKRSVRADGR